MNTSVLVDVLDSADFFTTGLFDHGVCVVSASAPAAMSTKEPVAAADSTTASVIDSAIAAPASDTTATHPK